MIRSVCLNAEIVFMLLQLHDESTLTRPENITMYCITYSFVKQGVAPNPFRYVQRIQTAFKPRTNIEPKQKIFCTVGNHKIKSQTVISMTAMGVEVTNTQIQNSEQMDFQIISDSN